ncbi:hypothetical protein B0H21DRAFT_674430, partial [Amylocystis lapponica]
MRAATLRLREFPSTFRDMLAQVALVQRFYLKITAILDWSKFYAPRFAMSRFPSPANEQIIGTVTTDPQVALTMHNCGIPVWLMRSPDHITPDLNI